VYLLFFHEQRIARRIICPRSCRISCKSRQNSKPLAILQFIVAEKGRRYRSKIYGQYLCILILKKEDYVDCGFALAATMVDLDVE
jgi:hypothetical protein